MANDSLLKLLRRSARFTEAELAERVSLSEDEVREQIAAWAEDGTILGYQAVVDPAQTEHATVSGIIEVKLRPERDGGFDRLAARIAKFDQVVSCYLMSGSYDLLLVVEGRDLMEVGRFVSEKLSSMEGVLSTASSFRLKTYKENGFTFGGDEDLERLPVAP